MLRLVAITSRPGEAGCSHPVNAREELRGDATESSLGGWLTACLCPGSSTSFSPQWIVRVCLLDLLSHLEGPDIWKEPFPAVGIPRRLRKERWVLLFPRGMKGGHESWCSFTKEPIKWKQNTHVPRAKRKGGRGSGLWSVTA